MNLHFNVTIETQDSTGEVLAVYFQIRKGKSAQLREFSDGAACADYNKRGELLGIELLAPCKVSIVDQIASEESVSLRRQAKRFMKSSGPRQMVPA